MKMRCVRVTLLYYVCISLLSTVQTVVDVFQQRVSQHLLSIFFAFRLDAQSHVVSSAAAKFCTYPFFIVRERREFDFTGNARVRAVDEAAKTA